MAQKSSKLRRLQISRNFQNQREFLSGKPPKKGWIREIREALGMSMQDLASRIGFTKQRIERIEKDELTGKLSLESLKNIAESLECDLVYFLVPKKDLEQIRKEQAYKAAKIITSQVNTTMKLENQVPSLQSQKLLIEEIATEMMDKDDRRIWKAK